MRAKLQVLLATLLLGAGARADPVRDAADAALTAHRAGDREAMAALARLGFNWHVAEDLLQRGEGHAAVAYADAAEDRDAKNLRAYVARMKDKPPDEAYEVAWTAKSTVREDPEGTLARLDSVAPAVERMTSYRIAIVRAYALNALSRPKEAVGAYDEAAAVAERLGNHGAVIAALMLAAVEAQSVGDLAGAMGRLERCLPFAEHDPLELLRLHTNLGVICVKLSRPEDAITHLSRAKELAEVTGDNISLPHVLMNLAAAYAMQEQPADAARITKEAIALAERTGNKDALVKSLGNLAFYATMQGDFDLAEECVERARPLAAGDRYTLGVILRHAAEIRYRRGDLSAAHRFYDEALRLHEATGSKADYARALAGWAGLARREGDYGRAIRAAERALSLAREVGARDTVTEAYRVLGEIYGELRDTDRSLKLLAEAEAMDRAAGTPAELADTLWVYGNSLADAGRIDEAEPRLREAVALLRGVHRVRPLAGALRDLGGVLAARGAREEAVRCVQEALTINREIGNDRWVSVCLVALSGLEQDPDEAGRLIGEALDAAKRARAPRIEATVRWELTRTHYARRENAEAVAEARAGLKLLWPLFGGLSEEEGAKRRETWTLLFRMGAIAAARADDIPSLAYFLESGRAGTLAEALVGRPALREAHVPADLLEADTRAAAALAAATEALHGAEEKGDVAGRKEARASLAAAREAREAAARSVQRAAKTAAHLVAPRPASIEEVQACLKPDEALVLYALTTDGAVALVVTPEDARHVDLGDSKSIEDAASGDTLRERIVAPLKLDVSVRRVLVSPDGLLCYTPFAQLMPDREVAMVPSGTILTLLRSTGDGPGKGVLALGDPLYGEGQSLPAGRTRILIRLPATRAEAKAVGDKVLLGAAASESSLEEAIRERPRWRAVHLACHGLIDPERPLVSSLALAPASGTDGFLTVLEVLRMQVPADLVVLSACETARGRVYDSEGVVGFVRAFLFAGAPRVLVSVDKVDDAATCALMKKFYELWNPRDGSAGLPAARALREAQAFVASQDAWHDPSFWAPWQLWGLPE